MSPALALVIALLASAAASVCAYADGALLAVDTDAAADDAALAAIIRRRDRAHRALAFARVTLQLIAGVASAIGVHLVNGLATIPLLALAVGGVVLVVLSETAARDAGENAGVAGLQRTRALVDLVERGLVAVVMLGEWLDAGLTKVLPPKGPTEEQEDESVERFRQVVTAEAAVGARETSILAGVFALGDTTVAEVMTPRVDIVGVDRGESWEEIAARFRTSERSRLVVCEGNLDVVSGVLFVKDVLPFLVANERPESGWHSLIRTIAFIPASKRVDAQLRDFRASRTHLAIVADEFGGTAGLVTIEDILELIVGEIQDEYDAEDPEIIPQGEGRFRIAGRMSLDQLSEILGDDVRHEAVTTVGGLVYELFGRVPQSGEVVEYRTWRIRVERVRRRRVERLLLERAAVDVGATNEVVT